MSDVKRPALRYHGGKFRLASWLLQFFPAHGCYVEPFGGAAGVLLRKPRAYAEVYNDLDGEIVNFFRVLRDPVMRADLIEACRLTPYARDEFDLSYEPTDDALERARRTCVRAAMGFGSAGATKASTGFRTDTRRKYGTAQHNWADYPGALGAIGERFSGVLIENRDAIDIIRAHDGPDTLFFVDPPYVHETRSMRNRGGVPPRAGRRGAPRTVDGPSRRRRHGDPVRLCDPALRQPARRLAASFHGRADLRRPWHQPAHRSRLAESRMRGSARICARRSLRIPHQTHRPACQERSQRAQRAGLVTFA